MLRLAVKFKQDSLYSKKIHNVPLKDLVKEINEMALPSIPDTNNILIPPPEFSLLKNNFQVYSEEIANKYTNPNTIKDNEINKNADNMEIDDNYNNFDKGSSSNGVGKKVLGKKKNRTFSHEGSKDEIQYHNMKKSNKIEIKVDNKFKLGNFTEGMENEEENFDSINII